MADTPQFEKVIKRLLSTPPKPHNAPKPAKGKEEKRPTRTVGKGRARVGKARGRKPGQ